MNVSCVPKPDGTIEVTARRGDTSHIINTILYADQYIGNDVECISNDFERGSLEKTGRTIWYWIRRKIEYIRDEMGVSKIKSPAKTIDDGYADCKSMSLLAAGILKNIGIPYKYRFVSYNKEKKPTHVYILAGESGEIAIDPVHHEFNREKNFTYCWDYDMNETEVKYMHGTPPGKSIPTREEKLKNAPKGVPVKPAHNYLDKTSGEFRLRLLKEQINIARSYYGDSEALRMATRVVNKAINGNLHREVNDILPLRLPDNLSWVGNEIKKASKMTRQEGGIEVDKRISRDVASRHGINGIGQGGVNVFNDYLKEVLYNCLEEHSNLEFTPPPEDVSWDEMKHHVRTRATFDVEDGLPDYNTKCIDILEVAEVMNDKLEDSSHHMLYEHFQGDVNSAPQSVAIKYHDHRGVIDAFQKISNLNRSNISLWTKNGIMRKNAEGGIEPFTPVETISRIKQGAEMEDVKSVQEAYSNDGVEGIIGAISAIVGILVSAIGAASKVVRLLNQKPKGQLLNKFQNVGTPAFSADTNDWGGASDTLAAGFGGVLPILALGGGAFFLMD